MSTKILGKTLKELRAMAKAHNIKGRSKMNYDVLRYELWKVIYGEDYIPKNKYECLEFLLLHPSEVVQSLSTMWMAYNGKIVIDALEVVSRSHATTFHESSTKESDIKTSQALKDRVKASITAIYSTVSSLSYLLKLIEDQYYSQRELEEWQGDVLYFVCDKGHLCDESTACQLFFYPSGENQPQGMSGWMLLEAGQQQLAEKLIKERWEYDAATQSYWVSRSEVDGLREYLEVLKTSGG